MYFNPIDFLFYIAVFLKQDSKILVLVNHHDCEHLLMDLTRKKHVFFIQ